MATSGPGISGACAVPYARRGAFISGEAASPAATWWDNNGAITSCVGAWAGVGAASQAASYTDLSGNGNSLTATGTTWDTSTGWTFDGINDYLATGILLTGNHTIIVRFSSAGGGDDVMGVTESPNRMGVRPNNFANTSFWYGNKGGGVATATAAGTVAVGGGASGRCYIDGVFKIALTDTWPGPEIPAPKECYIGGANTGAGVSYYAGDIQAAAIYDSILTDDEVAAVHVAMAAL